MIIVYYFANQLKPSGKTQFENSIESLDLTELEVMATTIYVANQLE